MNRLLAVVAAVALLCSCSEDKLDDYRNDDPLATVELTGFELDNYTLRVKAIVENNGAGNVLEYGVCYNPVEDGTPSHTNQASKMKFEKPGQWMSGKTEVEMVAQLMPEREYEFTFYAINSKGVSYSRSGKVTTGEMDIELMLEGKYMAQAHQSYYYMGAGYKYDDYEVEIIREDGVYYMVGISTGPLEVDAENVKLRMDVSKVTQGDSTYYKYVMPIQMTNLNYEQDGVTYPLQMVGGSWFFNTIGKNMDMWGYISVGESMEVTIESGYGLCLSDPITHELKLGGGFSPVDLVMANHTFPGFGDPEYDQYDYPRYECKLIKVIE